uniref:Ribonuclease H-like domain-containing protein n=1 Tax=Candidatus Desulfatibia profunda TaxID=2841695 RepID=A0A8J6NW24_9BACT|nr:ribonuclease H-like domain-containing protein [Candidatus Desulfatibia profunda]
MLKNTFRQVPGIGFKTEQRIWNSGIMEWDEFKAPYPRGFSWRQLDDLESFLEESKKQLENRNPGFFTRRLPPKLHWRLLPEFRDSIAYLDIETTGTAAGYDRITTIVLYDGKTVYWYVSGQNLENFKTDVQKYDVIVSYNGKCFDIPFVESDLGLRLDQAHIDLRYILASLGYKGGLKRCETLLGLDRGELKGVDGFFAVRLWHDYQRNNNIKALDTLLAYNIQDAVSLETLMVTAYNLKIKATPFADSHRLPSPPEPLVLFRPDRETIERLKRETYYTY